MRNPTAIAKGGDQPAATADRLPLLAVIQDTASQHLLDKLLDSRRKTSPFQILSGDIDSAIHHLRRQPSPQLLIVDISGHQTPLTAIGALADVCEPDTRVVVIGDNPSLDLFRELKDMGVDDYLTKPLNQEQLQHAISKATGQVTRPHQRSGKQLAITGCCGGVGVSTLAANLGRALAAHGAQTLITDLDHFGGDIDLLLDSQAGFGLMNLLSGQQEIDNLFVERACQEIDQRLFLLKSVGQRQQFEAERYHQLRQVLAKEYNYLVWDLPSRQLGQPGIGDTLVAADIRMLVMSPTLSSLRQCKAMLDMLEDSHHNQRTLLVLNNLQASRDALLTPAQIEEQLGQRLDHILPHAPRRVLRAAELGGSLSGGSHAFSRALDGIAKDILGTGVTGRRGLFSRWRRRA